MTLEQYVELNNNIEEIKKTLANARTPRPYRICYNKSYYDEMTPGQRIDYYKKHFDSILAFFGDHRLYVLQPDGSVIEFHGELEDMH